MGDFSICLSCGLCLRFGKRLELRAATSAEVLTLDPETQKTIARVTQAVLALQRHRKRH